MKRQTDGGKEGNEEGRERCILSSQVGSTTLTVRNMEVAKFSWEQRNNLIDQDGRDGEEKRN